MKLRLENIFLASALVFAGCTESTPQIVEAAKCKKADLAGVREVQALLFEFNNEAESEYIIEKYNGGYRARRTGQPGVKSQQIVNKYYTLRVESAARLENIQNETNCPMSESIAATWAFVDVHTNYTELVQNSEPSIPDQEHVDPGLPVLLQT